MTSRLRYYGWLVTIFLLYACYQQPAGSVQPLPYINKTPLSPTQTAISSRVTPRIIQTPPHVTATQVHSVKLIHLPPNPDGFPPRPPSLGAYPAAMARFLQQSPLNEARLEQLLLYWRALANVQNDNPTYSKYGPHLTHFDLDHDGKMELIVVIDGAVRDPVPGLVVVFQRQPTGQYTATTYALARDGSTSYGAQIITIQDLNQTPAPEIVILSHSVGACAYFITVTVLNWLRIGFQVLLEERMNGATMIIEPANANGIQPITLKGGGSSCYAPLSRTYTSSFLWDGKAYTLAATFADRITARHPYFKLMDGNDLAEQGDYQRAVQSYREALAEPYPWADPQGFWPYTRLDPLLRAVIRFRLMVSYIHLGNITQAAHVANESIRADQNYALIFTAFWQSYQHERNIVSACRQAMDTAGDDWRIPGYTVKDSLYDRSILCPTQDWEKR